jgi:epoxide hydrolase
VTPLEPFRIDVGDADLVDLRRRLSAARWPTRETVSDWSQGLPLEVLRELCEHWHTAYDWRATERRLNRLPTTEPPSTDSRCISFTCVRRSPKPFR